ncbi:MAG: hypothetical protein ABFS18_04640 [Thermodesulfobacteriota bacterium]
MDANSIFEQINAKLKELDIDEIRERIRPLMKGVRVVSPIAPAGTFLYRARKLDDSFNKDQNIFLADLKYPQPDKASLGRLNRDGQSVFYCSYSKEPIFFELPHLSEGDEIVLSFWKTLDTMLVNNIGYTEFIFSKFGTKRVAPSWSEKKIDDANQEITFNENSLPDEIKEKISHDENRILRELMSKEFMREVDGTGNYHYKLTAALAELHLGEIKNHTKQFAGILYPSIKMSANGDNFALQPDFVDRHLEFRKATHIRLTKKDGNTFSINKLDEAIELNDDNSLKWLGRLAHWVLNKPFQQATATASAGKDHNGDYEMSKDGTPVHWVLVDSKTGEALKPT